MAISGIATSLSPKSNLVNRHSFVSAVLETSAELRLCIWTRLERIYVALGCWLYWKLCSTNYITCISCGLMYAPLSWTSWQHNWAFDPLMIRDEQSGLVHNSRCPRVKVYATFDTSRGSCAQPTILYLGRIARYTCLRSSMDILPGRAFSRQVRVCDG